jgi:hypothetical protein
MYRTVKTPRRISPKHYGLFHGPLRIEVEDVKPAHRKPCAHCEGLPKGRRLKIVEGAGRGAVTSVYCSDCGDEWLDDHRKELERARTRLYEHYNDVCVRRRRDG